MSPSKSAPVAQDTVLAPGAPAAIPLNPEYLQQLNNLVSSAEALSRAGYVIRKLTDSELEQKRRCPTCGIRISKPPRKRDDQRQGKQKQPQLPQPDDGQQPRAEGSDSVASGDGSQGNVDKACPKLLCKFHPGKVISKAWTCCSKHVSAPPCTVKEDHDVRDDDRRTLESRWQFHATPNRFQPSHRWAVAIDCEMGTAFDGDSELIRLTVIDYFSGEPLIDSLVYPDVPMQHFNTRWSGVTRADMERSRRQRQCIMGKAAARAAVFRYVGPSTIVVGHGAHSDLSSLRWIHPRIVDSHIVVSARRKEAELKTEQEKKKKEGDKLEEGGPDKTQGEPDQTQGRPDKTQKRGKGHPDGMSLKALAMKSLGRAIQAGKKGHDSLEDALAARDLIHAHIADLLSTLTLLTDLRISGEEVETVL